MYFRKFGGLRRDQKAYSLDLRISFVKSEHGVRLLVLYGIKKKKNEEYLPGKDCIIILKVKTMDVIQIFFLLNGSGILVSHSHFQVVLEIVTRKGKYKLFVSY